MGSLDLVTILLCYGILGPAKYQPNLSNNLICVYKPFIMACRSDFVIESFSLRVIEVGGDIEKMSVKRVDPEVTESLASKENAGVWTVESAPVKHEVIVV